MQFQNDYIKRKDVETLFKNERHDFGIENPSFQNYSKSDATTISSTSLNSTNNDQEQILLQFIEKGDEHVKCKNYKLAIKYYSKALKLDNSNHILLINRSSAYLQLGEAKLALNDATAAKNLQPCWAQAYYHEALALEMLDSPLDAIASHSEAISLEPSASILLENLIRFITESKSLKKMVDINIDQLNQIGLYGCSSVILALVGQKFLTIKKFTYAIRILENALRIRTSSLRLRASIFSTLASAQYCLGELDKAIVCMQQDCISSTALNHVEGQYRSYSNLGVVYFKKGQYSDAIDAYKRLLIIATRCKQYKMTLHAISNLGYLYMTKLQFSDAISAHKQGILIARKIKDRNQEAIQMGNVGQVYFALGDTRAAMACHNKHLLAAKALKNEEEEARAYCNMAVARHRERRYEEALSLYNDVLNIARRQQSNCNITLQLKAYDGLGISARCCGQLEMARTYHEKQLDLALESKQKSAEARACSNLGLLYGLAGDWQAALKLHSSHIQIAIKLGDKTSECHAMFNMANCFYNLKQFEKCYNLYEKVLQFSRKLHNRHIESSCHLNIGNCLQIMQQLHDAAQHYEQSIKIFCELKDYSGEGEAIDCLAKLHQCTGHITASIPLYDRCISLWQQSKQPLLEANSWKFLSDCHRQIGNYETANDCLEKALVLGRTENHMQTVCQIYSSMAELACDKNMIVKSLEYAEKSIELARTIVDSTCLFNAQSTLGQCLMIKGDYQSAVLIYQQQLVIAKNSNDLKLKCISLSKLGEIYRYLLQYDKSLQTHNEQLHFAEKIQDLFCLSQAYKNLGEIYFVTDDFAKATHFFQEECHIAKLLNNIEMEAESYLFLAECRLSCHQFEEAIEFYKLSIETLDKFACAHILPKILIQTGKAFCKMGECYEKNDDIEEAIKCYERYLTFVTKANNNTQQIIAYRKLGNSFRSCGNLQQALICFERRLVLAHQSDDLRTKGIVCGELGCLHSLLGNFEQAIPYLEQQLLISRKENDKNLEADAACGLGGVYQQMSLFDKALEYHHLDLKLAEINNIPAAKCRAYGNLGLAYESLGNLHLALEQQEKHLNCSKLLNDPLAETLALSSLGRIQHALGKHNSAINYFEKALNMAQELGRMADKAKIHHRLGLAFLGSGNLLEALEHLKFATDLLNYIRRDKQLANDYRLSLFDLQTAAYNAQLRVLITMKRIDDALLLAEEARSRAFVELLIERQQTFDGSFMKPDLEDIKNTVVEHGRYVIYVALATGVLHVWLISAKSGKTLQFLQVDLNQSQFEDDDNQSMKSMRSASAASLLDDYITQARNALGVESHLGGGTGQSIEEEEEEEDNDSSGFFQLLRRSQISNRSVYSRVSKRSGISVATSSSICPFTSLYNLFLLKIEQHLQLSDEDCQHLTFILPADLYMLPWAILRSNSSQPYLFQNYSILIAPSLRCLKRHTVNANAGLVIGPPSPLPSAWKLLNSEAELETRIVVDITGWRCISGSNANKQTILNVICNAEVLHFVVHVSWRLSAIVLAKNPSDTCNDDSIYKNLLTASEILQLRFKSKLVVLSNNYSHDSSSINADGLLSLTRSFLAAGVSAVLVSLWPVPSIASRNFMTAFYTELTQGTNLTQALSNTQTILKSSSATSHASNWAGWCLIGVDNPILSTHTALLSDALAGLLKSVMEPSRPNREALRVILHLIEKSLQRMNQGEKRPMFTPVATIQQRINNNDDSWNQLLMAVGFRIGAQNSENVYFFPTNDPGQRLARCSTALQAFLALPASTLMTLSKLIKFHLEGGQLHKLLRNLDKSGGELILNLHTNIWRIDACHQFLASLGFDLIGVERQQVTVGGKHITKRILQLAIHALAALFDTAPVQLSLDSLLDRTDIKIKQAVVDETDTDNENYDTNDENHMLNRTNNLDQELKKYADYQTKLRPSADQYHEFNDNIILQDPSFC